MARVPASLRTSPVVPYADRVVVPVQGTDREFLAQVGAVELAAALGVPLHAVHVAAAGADDGEGPAVFATLRESAAKWGVPVSSVVLEGAEVARAVLDELEPRDIVVIGTRRLGTAFHVGSIAESLVRYAPCPVQVVRLPD